MKSIVRISIMIEGDYKSFDCYLNEPSNDDACIDSFKEILKQFRNDCIFRVADFVSTNPSKSEQNLNPRIIPGNIRHD